MNRETDRSGAGATVDLPDARDWGLFELLLVGAPEVLVVPETARDLVVLGTLGPARSWWVCAPGLGPLPPRPRARRRPLSVLTLLVLTLLVLT